MTDAARRVERMQKGEDVRLYQGPRVAVRHQLPLLIRISPLIDRLIDAFQMLPGVGPKWATRMTLYVLQHNREGGETLARSLSAAVAKVERCRECRTLCETQLCAVCANPKRDGGTLCVVESPADVIAIEQAGGYGGRYFVLHGQALADRRRRAGGARTRRFCRPGA